MTGEDQGSWRDSQDLPLFLIRIVLPASNSIGSGTSIAVKIGRGGNFRIDLNKFRRWQTVLCWATGLMVEVIDWPGHHQTRVFTVPIIKSHAAENHKWQSYWIETYNFARALNVVREMNNLNRRGFTLIRGASQDRQSLSSPGSVCPVSFSGFPLSYLETKIR